MIDWVFVDDRGVTFSIKGDRLNDYRISSDLKKWYLKPYRVIRELADGGRFYATDCNGRESPKGTEQLHRLLGAPEYIALAKLVRQFIKSPDLLDGKTPLGQKAVLSKRISLKSLRGNK